MEESANDDEWENDDFNSIAKNKASMQKETFDDSTARGQSKHTGLFLHFEYRYSTDDLDDDSNGNVSFLSTTA
jgi:hypothetical protein